jgi:hypothetical protein
VVGGISGIPKVSSSCFSPKDQLNISWDLLIRAFIPLWEMVLSQSQACLGNKQGDWSSGKLNWGKGSYCCLFWHLILMFNAGLGMGGHFCHLTYSECPSETCHLFWRMIGSWRSGISHIWRVGNCNFRGEQTEAQVSATYMGSCLIESWGLSGTHIVNRQLFWIRLFFFPLLVVLGFGLRVLNFRGKHSVAWAPRP